jgi:aspartate 1-decarboxylase
MCTCEKSTKHLFKETSTEVQAAIKTKTWYSGGMLIRTCMAKIHRATVTEADLNYVGSITIDEDLLDAAGIKPFQYLNITNVSNGIFWQTYAMAGKRGQGDICLNGPPARHFQKGDKVIILAEAWLQPSEFDQLNPVVVFVDEKNKVTEVKKHSAIAPKTTA